MDYLTLHPSEPYIVDNDLPEHEVHLDEWTDPGSRRMFGAIGRQLPRRMSRIGPSGFRPRDGARDGTPPNRCARTCAWSGPIFRPTTIGAATSRTTRPSARFSTARRMRSPVVDLLADLATAFAAEGVTWYLFGAQAAILHGAARVTADVDVTIKRPAALSNEALARALERARFRRRVVDPAFIDRTRVLPFVHGPTGLPLDVVLAGSGLEDQFFDRVVILSIDDLRVPIASAEDMVVMKILAGRPKDDDDVVAILAAHAETLDRAYVRRTLGELEKALGQSDLVPAFERALKRGRR